MKNYKPTKIHLGVLVKSEDATITINIPSKQRIEDLIKEVILEQILKLQINLRSKELGSVFSEAVSEARYTDLVSSLDLSNKALNLLDRQGIFTVGDLVTKSRTELSRIMGMGQTSINQIEKALALKHRRLGELKSQNEHFTS